jgi:hypothetical protein
MVVTHAVRPGVVRRSFGAWQVIVVVVVMWQQGHVKAVRERALAVRPDTRGTPSGCGLDIATAPSGWSEGRDAGD